MRLADILAISSVLHCPICLSVTSMTHSGTRQIAQEKPSSRNTCKLIIYSTTPQSLTAATNGTSQMRTSKTNKAAVTRTKSRSILSLDGCNMNNIRWSRNPVSPDLFSASSKTLKRHCQSCKKLTSCLPCATSSTSKAHIYWELTFLISTGSCLRTASTSKKHS